MTCTANLKYIIIITERSILCVFCHFFVLVTHYGRTFNFFHIFAYVSNGQSETKVTVENTKLTILRLKFCFKSL